MLLDLPRSITATVEPMLRVDLDGTVFQVDPTGFPEEVNAEAIVWASPNQVHKDIAPYLVTFLEPADSKKIKGPKTREGWVRLYDELVLISITTKEPLFQKAADLLKTNITAIQAMVKAARDKIAPKKAPKKGAKATAQEQSQATPKEEPKKTPKRKPYNRILFYMEGKPLQDHDAYKKYRDREFNDKRRKGKRPAIDASGAVHDDIMVTAPDKFEGAVLGPNIPLGDQEFCRWGYAQNTGAWTTDSDYIARLRGLEQLVKPIPIRTGDGKQMETLFVAPIRLTEALEEAVFGDALRDALHCDWASQVVTDILLGGSTATGLAPTETATLRVAVFQTENTRLRMVSYEPLSWGSFLRGVAQYQSRYKGTQFRDLVESMDAPRPKHRPVSHREALRWIRRILFGGHASLEEASSALNRYLMELKSGSGGSFRRTCQTKIMEDYMDGVGGADVTSVFYNIGKYISECADLVFQTGQLSFQNKSDNLYAKGRKADFECAFRRQAAQDPARTLQDINFKVMTYLGAIPATFASKKAILLSHFNHIQSACPIPIQPATPTDRLLIWKGYADQENRSIAEFHDRMAAKAEAEKKAGKTRQEQESGLQA